MTRGRTTVCNSCGHPITWFKTPRGKFVPYDAETVEDDETVFDTGTCHFRTCPNRCQCGIGVIHPDCEKHSGARALDNKRLVDKHKEASGYL